VDLFRRHVWMNPFWEDDVYEVIDLMGADHVIFGSDWPHIEGLPRPLDYLSEIQDLDDGDRRLVMGDNVRHLNVLQPVRA
jgi:predicted TIM-barrel fold metal-dependent hydrolase